MNRAHFVQKNFEKALVKNFTFMQFLPASGEKSRFFAVEMVSPLAGFY